MELFLVVVLAFVLSQFQHSLAEKRWLYTQNVTTGFSGWRILTVFKNGTTTRENASPTGSLSICKKVPSVEQIWLVSHYIYLQPAKQVTINANISISCQFNCVTKYINIDQDNALPFPNVTIFTKLNLTNHVLGLSRGNITMKKTKLVRTKGTFALFGIDGNNSHCLTLKQYGLHYNYCSNKSSHLVNFKGTPSPPYKENNQIDYKHVTGKCVANSEPINSLSGVTLSCDSTGSWKIKSGCQCKAGYELGIAGCSKCKSGFFKSSPGNESCLKCGLRTVTTEPPTSCPCQQPDKSDTNKLCCYREAKQGHSTEDCHRIPSAPTNPVIAKLTNNSAILRWDKPIQPGTLPDITYHIRCQKSSLCSNVQYLPSSTYFTRTNVTLTKLSPYSKYTFEIYSRNAVNNGAGKYLGITKEIITLKAVPSEIRNLNFHLLGNLLTVVWKIPSTLGDDEDAVSYIVSCDGYQTKTIKPKHIQFTIHNSQAGTFWKCEVTAKNSVGVGPSVTKLIPIPGEPTTTTTSESGYLSLQTILVIVVCVVIVIVIALVVLIWKMSKQRTRRNFRRGYPRFNNNPMPDNTQPNVYDAAIPPQSRVGVYGPQPHNYTVRVPNQAVIMSNIGQDNPGVDVENPEEPIYMEMDSADDLEFSHDDLSNWKVLDEGNFGVVYKASAKNICGNKGYSVVAVKMLKENAGQKDRDDFDGELNLMKNLKPHPHVLRLLGCTTWKEPHCIIIEFLPHGSLQKFLRKSRGYGQNGPDGEKIDSFHQTFLKPKQLLQFALEIADGMSHLASNNIIHRDLASRNVLVGHRLVCKIADLGLARDVNHSAGLYQREKQARLPVKWMAPEALFKGISSTKSDVWAFGVTLWEIVTIGDSPYPQYKSKEVLKMIELHYRMEQPPHCANVLFDIMTSCWEESPEKRPTFQELHSSFRILLDTNQDRIYINLDAYKDELYVNFDSEDEETGI